ncbi:MAG: carboxypeptidase M32, partial [Maritimibacter sp.]|nr:carboxypeptidase M32 [Maritimibacter sp.]
MGAFEDLMAFERQTQALTQVNGRLNWDQETMMPRGAAPQRAVESEAMEQMLHGRRTHPRVGAWLAQINEGALDSVGRANLRHIRRRFDRTRRVPSELAGEIARVSSSALGTWAEARKADDVASFLPVLEEIVRLKREEAAALCDGGHYGGDLYDALIDDYEPEATGAELAAMFDALRPRLVALRDRVMGAAHQPAPLEGSFAEGAQVALAGELAVAFGYNLGFGRIDKSVHPFSSGSGLDVRITMRTSKTDPFNCVYATIHETGHACYEQNISRDHLLTPLGAGVSMGVHESQSRLYENQLGRSRAFTGWLFGRFAEKFGGLNVADAEAFWGTVNRVSPGYIRTEADEVQYNLHVLLRFDLERQLVAGELDVADLEEAWNARFLSDFGVAVDRPSNGILQDGHWALGLFGYFPTYSLGNVYAGCLHRAMRAAMPDLDTHLAKGDPATPARWLKDNLQVHGGLYEPRELVTRACGFEPSVDPLLDYLDAKFAEIYR